MLLAVAPPDLPASFVTGGSHENHVDAVATDPAGNIIIAGITDYLMDLDLRADATRFPAPRTGSTWDPFVAKIAPDGRCLWAITIDADEMGVDRLAFGSVTTDSAGNVLLAGNLRGTVDMDSGSASRPLSSPAGVEVAVILKLTSDGGYAFAATAGRLSPDKLYASAIAADGSGGAFVVTTEVDNEIATLAKVGASGRAQWSIRIPRVDPRSSVALGVDPQDRLVLATGGNTLSLLTFNARGKFVSRAGVAAPYAPVGQPGTISPASIDFDRDGNILLAGSFTHTFDFAPGKAMRFLLHPKHDSAWNNIFCAKYTPGGGGLVFAFALGATAQDNPAGARFDRASGDVLLAGEFSGRVDLDPSARGVALYDSGDPLEIGDAESDLFAARYSPIGRFRSAQVLQTAARDRLARGSGLVADDRILAISNNYFPSNESQRVHFFQPPLPATA
jgi:hypothetical protein